MRAIATLHVEPQHHVELQHVRNLVGGRLAVRSRPGLGCPKEETDRVLERRRFRDGAEAASDQFGGVSAR